MANRLGQILVPLVTPFKANEDVCYDTYEKLIEFVITKKYCDSIIITGTTGEFNALTFDERVQLFKTGAKAAGGRVPVIAGTGGASTRETIALTNAATAAGATCAMIVAPYYSKPTQGAILEHFKMVHDATNIDILLYNIPIFTGVNMDAWVVGELAKLPRVIGIKDEAGINPTQITDYYYATQAANPNFLLFNGDDIMLMPTIAQGAVGIVSGGAHVVGDRIKSVFRLYAEGKVDQALDIFRQIYRLFRLFGLGGRIHPNSVMRPAVEMVSGLTIGPPRRPLNPINAEERAQLVQVLKEIKVL